MALETSYSSRQTYSVVLKNTEPVVRGDFQLEGGEWLQLEVSADGRMLEHRLFKDRILQFVPPANRQGLLDPRDSTRQYRLGFHRPERQGTAMRFPISVQNPNPKEFSPRPAEAWVDIVPVYPHGPNPNQVYTFYDMALEEDRPVPVLDPVPVGAANNGNSGIFISRGGALVSALGSHPRPAGLARP